MGKNLTKSYHNLIPTTTLGQDVVKGFIVATKMVYQVFPPTSVERTPGGQEKGFVIVQHNCFLSCEIRRAEVHR